MEEAGRSIVARHLSEFWTGLLFDSQQPFSEVTIREFLAAGTEAIERMPAEPTWERDPENVRTDADLKAAVLRVLGKGYSRLDSYDEATRLMEQSNTLFWGTDWMSLDQVVSGRSLLFEPDRRRIKLIDHAELHPDVRTTLRQLLQLAYLHVRSGQFDEHHRLTFLLDSRLAVESLVSARRAASRGDSNTALELLDLASRLHYLDAEFGRDPEFSSLEGNPDFESIVQRVQRNASSQREK